MDVRMKAINLLAGMLIAASPLFAHTWTLQRCISYATEHSLDLQKKRLSELDAKEVLAQSKASLLPTLSASTNQGVTNRPWASSTNNVFADGAGNMTMSSSSMSTTYNGNYGLTLGYTLWNGGRRSRTIEQNELSLEKARLSTEEQLNLLKQQIVQNYVQTLYAKEAITVNEGTLAVAKAQRDRAAEMVRIGSLSKADLSQLEAQVAQDEYNVVNAQTSMARYLLNLKQLLELPSDEPFDVANITISDDKALAAIPSASDIYTAAMEIRPELREAKLSVDIAEKQIAIAKTGNLPTVNLSAGVSTTNHSGSDNKVWDQWKKNWSNSAGVTVSVPILSQRQNRTAVERAKLQRQTAELEVQNQQKLLRNTIDGYYLDATSAQAQLRSALVNVVSMQTSFDLLSEQFNLGLKNLVELMDGKNNLLRAQQTKLQAKYTAILNQQLLKYYAGEEFDM